LQFFNQLTLMVFDKQPSSHHLTEFQQTRTGQQPTPRIRMLRLTSFGSSDETTEA